MLLSPQSESSAGPIQATDAPARRSSLVCWLWLPGGCRGRWHSEPCSDRGAQCLGTQLDERLKLKTHHVAVSTFKRQQLESWTWQSGFVSLPLASLYWLGAAGRGEVAEGGGDLVRPSGLSPASATSSSSSLAQREASGDTRSERYKIICQRQRNSSKSLCSVGTPVSFLSSAHFRGTSLLRR